VSNLIDNTDYKNKIVNQAEDFALGRFGKEKLLFYNKNIDSVSMTTFLSIYIIISNNRKTPVSFDEIGRIISYASNSSEIIDGIYKFVKVLKLLGNPSDMLFYKYVPKDDELKINSIW